MIDKSNIPVFVTGVERSGISIVAKIINLCGAFCGNITEMQENIRLKQMVDYYYDGGGFDRLGQNPIPNPGKLWIPTDWNNCILRRLKNEKYDGKEIWMYKSSRICQIWPVWNYAFPNARYIIVRRKTSDIIESCMKTAFMKGFEDREGWLNWIHIHEKRFCEMIEAGLNCKVIWPERMMRGDYYQIYEMLDWLGLDWNEEIVQTIDPLFLNSRKKERSE